MLEGLLRQLMSTD